MKGGGSLPINRTLLPHSWKDGDGDSRAKRKTLSFLEALLKPKFSNIKSLEEDNKHLKYVPSTSED